MKIKILISFILPAIILLLLFLGLNNKNYYETKNLIGKKISDFEIKKLNEDKLVNRKSLSNNNFTLINFFASWCGPCRLEHSYLLSLKKDNKLQILGINFKDKKANAINFLNELGNPYYEILKDSNGKESVNFGIYGIPESILIDKNFKIIKKFIGPINKNDYEEIIKIIKN